MRALKILKSAEVFGFSAKQIIIGSHKLDKAISELEALILENQNLKAEKQELIQVLINAQETINKILEK